MSNIWQATISIDHPNGKEALSVRVRVETNESENGAAACDRIWAGEFDTIANNRGTKHAKTVLEAIGVTNIDKYLMHLIASDEVEIFDVEREV